VGVGWDFEFWWVFFCVFYCFCEGCCGGCEVDEGGYVVVDVVGFVS